MKLSIVIPVFNEEALLRELHLRLRRALVDLPLEIIFVNDGSTDSSLEILRELSREDASVTVLSLSRNFGHQQSITAGLAAASGDALVIMDGDLEDPPEVIPDMLVQWESGAKVVEAHRRSRRLGLIRRVATSAFHRLFHALADVPMPLGVGVFCLLDRTAYRALRSMEERNRFIPGLRAWVGFRTGSVWYDRPERAVGGSKQSLSRLIRYGFDAIFSFSYRPLRLSLVAGFILFFLSSSYAAVLVVLRLLDINVVSGFTTTSVAILFFGGAILVSNGILGEYLGRIYDEVKRRPQYVIEEVIHGRSGSNTPESPDS